jgi:hypothetical protein
MASNSNYNENTEPDRIFDRIVGYEFGMQGLSNRYILLKMCDVINEWPNLMKQGLPPLTRESQVNLVSGASA